MKRLALLFSFAASVLFAAWSGAATDTAAGPVELAQNKSHICYNDCMDKHGTDSKAACARQCGLIGGSSGPAKDCAKIYRNCTKGCGKDKNCKKRCRTANRSCV
ncbi:MAG: hypothetical protein QF830_06100 [Rhodospirillales bacterium]|jgi:hypothetical protein|nr:hypothetical protein [Rhodospirillales bacterium]MDP6883685.1 hypothetical protein [Rhodospirillales bacterium]